MDNFWLGYRLLTRGGCDNVFVEGERNEDNESKKVDQCANDTQCFGSSRDAF